MSIPFLNALEAPRLTDGERDGLSMPGTGSLIYNTTDNMLQINVGTPEVPDWQPVGISTSDMIVEPGFPTSPFHGQRILYMDNINNPKYKWQMMYNANRSGPNKWECIGGDPWIVSNITQSVSTGPNDWRKFTVPGNALSIYHPGEYIIEFGFGSAFQFANYYYDFNTQVNKVGPGGAGITPGTYSCESGIPGSGDNSSVTVEIVHTGAASSLAVANLVQGELALYENRGAGTSGTQQGWMKVIPKCFS